MIPSTLTCETKRIKRQDCVSQHYCGRRLGQIAIPRSDGRCGPNNGRQCASCARYQASVREAVVAARSVDREATTSANQAAFASTAMAAFAREPGRARAPDDQAALHRQDGEPETTLGQGARMCVSTSQLGQAALSQLISNEGSKDSTPAVKVFVGEGVQSFGYFTFTPTKVRGRCGTVQISRLLLERDDITIDMADADVRNWDGRNPPGEGPANVADGCADTKWTDRNMQSLEIKFPSRVSVHAFRFATEDGEPARDPIQWRFTGSNDGIEWTPLYHQGTDYPTPSSRKAVTATFALKEVPSSTGNPAWMTQNVGLGHGDSWPALDGRRNAAFRVSNGTETTQDHRYRREQPTRCEVPVDDVLYSQSSISAQFSCWSTFEHLIQQLDAWEIDPRVPSRPDFLALSAVDYTARWLPAALIIGAYIV